MMHPRTKNYIQEKILSAMRFVQQKYNVPITLLSSEDLHIEDFQVRYTLTGRSEISPGKEPTPRYKP